LGTGCKLNSSLNSKQNKNQKRDREERRGRKKERGMNRMTAQQVILVCPWLKQSGKRSSSFLHPCFTDTSVKSIFSPLTSQGL
jgi:hypothetical protein